MNPIEVLKNLLNPGLLEKMGGVVGLQAPQVSQALDSILPLQLQAMIHKSETPEGSRDLFHTFEQSVSLADVSGTFSRPDGVQTLMQKGEGMLGSLFGGRLEGVLAAVSRFTGLGGGELSHLMKLSGPLLGGVLGGQMLEQGVSQSGLSGWLGSMKGTVGAMLPPSLSNLLGMGTIGATSTLGTAGGGVVAAGVGAIGAAGMVGASNLGDLAADATPRAGAALGDLNARASQASGSIGGAVQGGVQGAQVGLGGGLDNTSRGAGGAVPTSTVVTPAREEERRGGAGWLWPLVGLLAVGGLAYWFFNQNNAVAPAVSTTSSTPVDTASSPTDTSSTVTSSTPVDTSTTASSGELKITEPASGNLPAGAFTLKGTGTAGQEVDVLEDGTSVGKATVGADGTWSLDIPSPAAGARNYEVKAGAASAKVALTVAASSGSAASCTKAFTLSVVNGSSVTQPFRFGGVGKGSAYVVTVKRGDRTVGSKEIALDGSCGWSYRSNPGKGPITYVVSEKGSSSAATTVNLTVQ